MSYWETRTKVIVGIIAAVVVIGLIALIRLPFKFAYNDHDCVATVTDKERHESGYYLIFCKDLEGNTKVFKDDDTLLRWKWNSSDMYQEIEIGKTYLFHLNGYRSEFWSFYENILSFEEYIANSNDYQDDQQEINNDTSTDNSSNAQKTNLKIIPEVTEETQNPYSISIQFYSENGIAIKKLYKPEKSNELDVADQTTIRDTIFANGMDIFGTSFEVSENGVYWIYIQEISGEEYTQRFIIENFR